MAFSELIKNFDNIRSYMKEFFIYGFKTREEYDKKSARSYDNERRRIQSYLGDLVSFRQTPSGKNMFISLDGRSVTHNPLPLFEITPKDQSVMYGSGGMRNKLLIVTPPSNLAAAPVGATKTASGIASCRCLKRVDLPVPALPRMR